MSEKNNFAALQEIRNWSIDDVVCSLRNNGLEECVDACKKRDVDGKKLLELSEMKLGLWKRDLTIANIRKLAVFIDDVMKTPTKYLFSGASYSDDAWDTDFDDDDETDENESIKTEKIIQLEKKHENNFPYHNGNFDTQNSLSKSCNSQFNKNQVLPVYKNFTSQIQTKINIPLAFSSQASSTNTSMNGSSNSYPEKNIKQTSNDNRLKENKQNENRKPLIPSRPPNLLSRHSPQNNKTALPKPPAFDDEGSVLREICDKLKLEPDVMDEYESIDDEILRAQSIKNHISQLNPLRGLKNPEHSDSTEKFQNSLPNNEKDITRNEGSPFSMMHRSQLLVSQKINMLSQQISKSEQNHSTNNVEKSIHSVVLSKTTDETIHKTQNTPFVNKEQEKLVLPLAPHLPLENGSKQVASPESLNASIFPKTIDRTLSNDIPKSLRSSYTINEDIIHKENAEENTTNENIFNEEVYESIPENVSSTYMKENCEYADGYCLPKTPPTLPPKLKQTTYINKVSEQNTESNGVMESSTSNNFQKQTIQRKIQEKVSPDGKKNNTLPLSRPVHSYIVDSPKPSASRPLPPPPPLLNDGLQRIIKVPLVQMPWYFNVDRIKGEEIIQNCEDGTFMIRPSRQTPNALTLTLKYGKTSFNICVRLRPDGRFALGTAKSTEQTFSSVEELVNHYTSNELLLYRGGKPAGVVVLTSPPRKSSSNQ